MSPTVTRVLTGITTSGTPHLGNYAGAIRPAIAASRQPGVESFYFLADYHALIKVQEPARVQRSTLEIAASWLACGLDPDKVWFYRQSDIPEIPELTWLLTCVAGKGLLNRAHAYKASVDKNREAGEDDDAGITAGLFMYPVLMAADILMFKANKVPVGRDQIQHIEMARDFASRFNYLYGGLEHLKEPKPGEGSFADYKPPFVLPEAVIDESVATLPGLDGRKMSKSYDNTIPLFASPAYLKKLILSIKTDSRAPGEAKDTEGSALFQLYQAFSSPSETEAMAKAFADGIAWGEAKQQLFERINVEVTPMREKYDALMARPGEIEDILKSGSEKARKISREFMKELRHAVGLRRVSGTYVLKAEPGEVKISGSDADLMYVQKPPEVKQYRDKESGRFYFKILDADGSLVIQSKGFETSKDVGFYLDMFKRSAGKAKAIENNNLVFSELTVSPEISKRILGAVDSKPNTFYFISTDSDKGDKFPEDLADGDILSALEIGEIPADISADKAELVLGRFVQAKKS